MAGTGARKLGFWALLALVVGNMIGSGIYLLPATLAPLGWNQAIGWIVTLGGALCLAAVFAGLSARIPRAGGPYAYAYAAFGPVAGYVAAWSYWVMTWVGNGAIAIAVVSNLSLIFPVIGSTPYLPAAIAVTCVWLLTLVNLRGVRAAGRVQEVTTVLKILPLIALVALAAWFVLSGEPRAPDPGIALSSGAIATAAGLTFWGFLGLESATVPADKVDNAERNVPRATMIGVALTGMIYLGISMAFALYMPVAEATASPAPVADFLGKTFGPGIAVVVAVFAAISAFGALNGWILVQGEMPWAMAKGGVFPAWFARENANGTPVRGHLVSSALLTGIVLINSQKGMGKLFEFVGSVSISAGLVAYLLSALAALRLVRGSATITLYAVIAAAFTLWAEWGLGLEANLYGALLILAGLALYPFVRTAGSSAAPAGQPG